MFGITFPLNFFSPYKADSLIDFWRRWHMTLSRFLRDYLYFPLGGNRKGTLRRYLNLMVTMLLGGLWHGASWNFALWGGLHGLGLLVNHAWRGSGKSLPWPLARAATLMFVVLAWVPFRASSFDASAALWRSMAGLGTGPDPSNIAKAAVWIAVLGFIALVLPNTAEILGRAKAPVFLTWRLSWRLSSVWALGTGLAAGVAIAMSFAAPVSFLYFRF
jgi:D-alanyl-lipoteichoic acid acyltransferase DltB (MBOAT superfamily)